MYVFLYKVYYPCSPALQVIDNAEAQYLAFFSAKTVGMIRAPDHYVYPPPTNLCVH